MRLTRQAIPWVLESKEEQPAAKARSYAQTRGQRSCGQMLKTDTIADDHSSVAARRSKSKEPRGCTQERSRGLAEGLRNAAGSKLQRRRPRASKAHA